MEIRNFYNLSKTNSETGLVEIISPRIPDDIFKCFPLYKNKVKLAMQTLMPEELSGSDDENSIDLNELVLLMPYQLLNQDQTTITHIIENIEAYLADLQTKPSSMLSGKQLHILSLIVLLLIYLPIEIWLGMRISSLDIHAPTSMTVGYLAMIMFGVFGGCLITAVAIWGFLMYRNGIIDEIISIPAKISRNEWKSMIDMLQNSLLEKLQFLEKKELDDKQAYSEREINYLPVPEQIIRNLENNLAEFESESKTVNEMKDTLIRLDAILQQIKQGLLVTNKPFSRFFKPAECQPNALERNTFELRIEEMSDEDSSQEGETRLLMGGQVS
jgi:hypothetical protein